MTDKDNKKGRIPVEDTTDCRLSSNYSRYNSVNQINLNKLQLKLRLHRLRILPDNSLLNVIARFMLVVIDELEGNSHD